MMMELKAGMNLKECLNMIEEIKTLDDMLDAARYVEISSLSREDKDDLLETVYMCQGEVLQNMGLLKKGETRKPKQKVKVIRRK